ncbi:ABC transporter ATP-binding protein [Alicyclobacillus sp. ALC3]|uniref:ABC transporter ATP-binding protein n=1 Tax=Alicyclobacillus sp. ALC3 TaxID=2796143 RepID=UPI002378AE4D|nr:ABC transporter ATP-binding protein [Alicyclobacillus sp. ALC3]WDL96099.1 ABC transporter ATP-binding protein [Alicyclobacillus sp. ALC3]
MNKHRGTTQTVATKDTTRAVSREGILKLENVSKVYTSRDRSTVAASNVNFTVEPGTIVALIGESGSGKSTLARLITGIERPTSGRITFGKWDVIGLKSRQLRRYRKHVQMVFQDPFAALNPQNTVLYSIVRPLRKHLEMSESDARQRAMEIMETVRLTPVEQFVNKRPHQLSGGQRQRLVIARAIAPEPDLIVADEPVSMLDVSIRAHVLELINEIRHTRNMSVVYITHDILSARVLADQVVVLYRGHVVERGVSDEVLQNPQHPYTRLLFASVPNPFERSRNGGSKGDERGRVTSHMISLSTVSGESGCTFAPRCPYVMDKCLTSVPALSGSEAHQTACYWKD